jgi:hypothetical protein
MALTGTFFSASTLSAKEENPGDFQYLTSGRRLVAKGATGIPRD